MASKYKFRSSFQTFQIFARLYSICCSHNIKRIYLYHILVSLRNKHLSLVNIKFPYIYDKLFNRKFKLNRVEIKCRKSHMHARLLSSKIIIIIVRILSIDVTQLRHSRVHNSRLIWVRFTIYNRKCSDSRRLTLVCVRLRCKGSSAHRVRRDVFNNHNLPVNCSVKI